MRIYSYFVEDDIVGGVYIIDEEKHKDADERVAQLNKECGREAYRIFDIPKNMEQTILYLFGRDKYKCYSDMDDLESSMRELSSSVGSLHEDTYDISQAMSRLEKEFEEFKKNFGKEDTDYKN